MMEIARNLGVGHGKVYYWFKKYNIERRNGSESAYLKQNPNGDPFKIKRTLGNREKRLLLIGLMLYWAEGNKKNKTAVQLGNLDYRMLKVFLNFLRQICRVDESRVTLYVRVHKNFSPSRAKKYWVKTLQMSEERVLVYPHTDNRSTLKKQWSQFGIATLQINNTKLKKWLDDEIDTCLEKYN